MTTHANTRHSFPSHRLHPFLVLVLLAPLVLLSIGCAKKPSRLRRPTLIKASPDGHHLAVFDTEQAWVFIVDRHFRHLKSFAVPDAHHVWGMAFLSEDRLMISNTRSSQPAFSATERRRFHLGELLTLDLDGHLLRRLQWSGYDGLMVKPAAILPQPDGGFYLTDLYHNSIALLGSDGALLQRIGSHGHELDQLYYPGDLAFTPDGKLAVMDAYHFQTKIFTPDGRFLRAFGGQGSAPGRLDFPQNFAIDASGSFYCSELASMRLSKFDAQGRFAQTFDPLKGVGWKDGQTMQLYGVAVLESPREIFVADGQNGRVFVFDEQGKVKRIMTNILRKNSVVFGT